MVSVHALRGHLGRLGILLVATTSACAGSPGPADAAREVATHDPLCQAIAPFYWAIGDAGGTLASGSVGEEAPTATTTMPIASASKWLYGAYVVEVRDGSLTANDVQDLTFRLTNTVQACFDLGNNGKLTPENVGRFYYGGGHMQKHAVDLGLGPLTTAELATEIRSKIGEDVGLTYMGPHLAGGGVSTASDYARFLRHILDGTLAIGAMLGAEATCTNPSTCADAVYTPIPEELSWHYSLGHWVEDDPTAGDGSFSSPGAFGFYPWIDATKTFWGVVARVDLRSAADPNIGAGYESHLCGSRIREAFLSATALLDAP